jgi:class 3 adenylate cyclase
VLGAGLVLLAGATAAAAALGRAIARPVGALARAAAALEGSRFAEARALAGPVASGRVRETAAAADALDRAAEAIALFETYVPRALVRRLRRSGPEAARPRAAEIAALFLDLEGFSAFAAAASPAEAAAYLDAVFAVAGPRIEAAGGIVDKFTGDGLLAVWGAPEPAAAPARQAVAVALGLAEPLAALHAARRAAGLRACRVRIAVHVGRVVVGDLGYPGRVDYTVVGGAVNEAARAQSALRGIDPAEPVVIAATEAALAAADLAGRASAEPVPWAGAGVLLRLRPGGAPNPTPSPVPFAASLAPSGEAGN